MPQIKYTCICLTCDIVFLAHRTTGKYCSRSCQSKAPKPNRRKPTQIRLCICGTDFVVKTGSARQYCSRICSSRYSRMSEAGRKRVSEAAKRAVWTPERRASVAERSRGNTYAKETRGRKNTEETLERMRAAWSEERKATWSETIKQRMAEGTWKIPAPVWSEESRKRLGETIRQQLAAGIRTAPIPAWSEESRKLVGDSLRKAYQNGTRLPIEFTPEILERIVKNLEIVRTAYWATEEAQEKRREYWKSEENREKKALTSAKALAEGRMPNKATSIEKILWKLLENAGFEVIRNHRVGTAVCDAYLPQENLALEADGWYWHGGRDPEDKIKDAARDARLLERFNLPVVRLTEKELRDIGKQLSIKV